MNFNAFAILVSISLAFPAVGVAQDAESPEVQGEKNSSTVQEENPYLCPKHWTSVRLLDFLQSSEEKPRSIRRRDEFVRAIEDAADRLMDDGSVKQSWARIALLTKARTLHYHACWGNDESDSRLKETVALISQKKEKAFLRESEFYRLERELIDFGNGKDGVTNVDSGKLITLLNNANDYLDGQILVDRHLRMASNIVRVINLIEMAPTDDDEGGLAKREEQFSRFGELFTASADLRMSQYGKSLAKPAESGESLVGSEFELSGKGLDENRIDLKEMRGQVVVVDFWATWCGPCVREMPKLIKLYDELESMGFQVVGVNLDGDLDDVVAFVEEHDLYWPNIVEGDASAAAKKYGVRGIPTMVLIDQQGKVVAVENSVEQIAPLARKLIILVQK